MSIETITKLLEGVSNKDAILKDVKATIQEDVDKKESDLLTEHKAEIKKRNSENKNLRDRVKLITKKFDLDLESDDLEDMLDELKDKMDGKKTDDSELAKTVKKLQKELEKEQSARAADNKEKEELKIKSRNESTRSSLRKVLNENGVKASDEDVTDLLMGKVEYDEDGEATLKLDGKNVSFADGVKSWLEPESRRRFIDNEQNPGGGSGSGGGKGSPNEKPSLESRRAELRKMNKPMV